MPFQYVLAELLAKVPAAVATVFLDDSGETIEVATTDFSPEELKILGAYFGISLRQARGLVETTRLGNLEFVYLRQGKLNLHAVCMPDDYCLVLVQSAPSSATAARRHLKNAVADLERELFV